MTLEELTAKLEAIDKELLPLFAKKGRSKEECDRVAKLEAESEVVTAQIRAAASRERMADPAYLAKLKEDAKHLKALPKES